MRGGGRYSCTKTKSGSCASACFAPCTCCCPLRISMCRPRLWPISAETHVKCAKAESRIRVGPRSNANVAASGRFAENYLYLNASKAGKSNSLGTRRREIDDTALDIRAAVIDANDHEFASREVGDFDLRPKRQSTMSCGKRMRMGIFAIGSAFTAIHRSNSGLGRCQKWR